MAVLILFNHTKVMRDSPPSTQLPWYTSDSTFIRVIINTQERATCSSSLFFFGGGGVPKPLNPQNPKPLSMSKAKQSQARRLGSVGDVRWRAEKS